jgi:hypothetical protein
VHVNTQAAVQERSKPQDQNYIASFVVDQTPKEVFDAINNPRGWWSEDVEGDTAKLGAVWFYHYKSVHRCTLKIIESVPATKVVWHVLDNYFNFIDDKTEWIGTDVVFDIAKRGDKTELHFTHVGLVPTYECYNACSDAWGGYIKKSLHDLISTGKGAPNAKEALPAHQTGVRRPRATRE